LIFEFLIFITRDVVDHFFIFRDVQSVTNDVSKSISQKTKKNSYSVHTSSIDASGTRIQEKSVSIVFGKKCEILKKKMRNFQKEKCEILS